MKKEYRVKLEEQITTYFIRHETWNTPHFAFKDNDIAMAIFSYDNPYQKNQIYTIVKKISMKAEDGIADRMGRLGEDYYLAKDYMKFKMHKPLLIKIYGWGWREPDFDDLDDDQRKRFEHHKKAMNFSKRRSVRINEMREIQERLNESN